MQQCALMYDLIDDCDDLFENAPCGYLTLTADGRIFRTNATLQKWLGLSRADLIGKRLGDLLNMPGRIFYETHIAPLLRMQGFFEEVALDFVTKSDERVPVIANAVEHRDASGNALFTRIAFLRAADRRRYERELLSSRAAVRKELEGEAEIARFREQFIAVLGHDLRNPLASISAGARMLMREPRNEFETGILEVMQSAVTRMASLIDDTLDLTRARIGSGLPVRLEADVDIGALLHQVVEELHTAHPGRAILEQFQIDRNVTCDRTRIGQLASNLIGNALTHGAADEPVQVRASTVEETFQLSVANGGDPIPEQAMSRLFEPFFRGEVRDSQQGLGLGLYIASEIAKAHGGELTVSSTSEETRFTLRMPLNG